MLSIRGPREGKSVLHTCHNLFDAGIERVLFELLPRVYVMGDRSGEVLGPGWALRLMRRAWKVIPHLAFSILIVLIENVTQILRSLSTCDAYFNIKGVFIPTDRIHYYWVTSTTH